MKKLLKTILTMSLAICLLCGCEFSVDLGNSKTAKTTQEVIDGWKEASNKSNMHVEFDMSYNCEISYDGSTISMPISMNLSGDVIGHNSHSITKMKISLFGSSMESTNETYTVEDGDVIKSYSKDSDDDYWYVAESSASDIEDVGLITFDDKQFEDAEMTYDKKEKTYTITQSFINFLESDTADSLSLTDAFGLDQKTIEDIWKDATMVYVFDKDFNLLSARSSNAAYEGPLEQDGETADVKMSIEFKVNYSKFGEIKESDVEVPKTIVDEAAPRVTIDGDVNFSWGDDEEDYSWGDGEADDSFGGYGDDSDYNQGSDESESESSDDNSQQYSEMLKMDDVLGSYNGVNFTLNGDSWDSTFGTDGWVLEQDDELYSFISASNEKYGKWTYLNVYNKQWKDVTADDIIQNGIYGYSIELDDDIVDVPNMTWNGLTFGATSEDILAAYGEPYYSPYEGTTYTAYTFEVDDDTEIEFYVSKDGLGLRRVKVVRYCSEY